MKVTTRTLEELIGLQDQAIQALRQANQALQLALDALQKNRDEKGVQQPMFITVPAIKPDPAYVPYAQPTWIGTPLPIPSNPWGGGMISGGGTWHNASGGLVTNTIGSASQEHGSVLTVTGQKFLAAQLAKEEAKTIKAFIAGYSASAK